MHILRITSFYFGLFDIYSISVFLHQLNFFFCILPQFLIGTVAFIYWTIIIFRRFLFCPTIEYNIYSAYRWCTSTSHRYFIIDSKIARNVCDSLSCLLPIHSFNLNVSATHFNALRYSQSTRLIEQCNLFKNFWILICWII